VSIVFLMLLGLSNVARAQGTGRSLDIDPSVRASGMGLAANAVFWDSGTDHWGNPALLGDQRGLAYEYGNTQLVPGLAADVHFTTNVIKLGGAGLGLAFSGKPFGLGGLHLSYGESEGTDASGNPTGTFESFEQVDAWSLGLSLARAAETIAELTGHDPKDVSRYGDVALGVTGKKLDMELGPLGSGGTSAHDLGFLVRVSPIQFIPNIRDVVGLDLSYGVSTLSAGADVVVFPNQPPAPVSEHDRRGFALRGTLDWPSMANALSGPRWLWDGLHPLLSVGHADDHSKIAAPYPYSSYETDGDGWEVTVANLYSWRTGHYEDLVGQIDGNTSGWSVGLPIGGIGGVRYDSARIPQAMDSGLPDVERHAVTAWIDALRLYRMWRS
jgi:hypothetical protein